MFIQARNLTKIYSLPFADKKKKNDVQIADDGSVVALDHVSLNIERGEFVSIVGSSGSGKSTLLHLLGGLDSPTDGTVIIGGKDIHAMKSDDLTVFRRRSVGFVFQNYNLIPMLNVYENIMISLGLDGMKPDEQYINSLIDTLKIRDKLYNLSNRLSGGQQQRVAIARALASRPDIVLADEPTGNLDSKTGLEVVLLLKQLNEIHSQTIVMITHNEEVAQFAERRIRIEDGKIVSDSASVSAKAGGAENSGGVL